jgi:hypothetical protein
MGYDRENKQNLFSFSARAAVVVTQVFKQPRPLIAGLRPGRVDSAKENTYTDYFFFCQEKVALDSRWFREC